jgi:catechol 2,3-dioxygenase-like lactoylglutathione lyase family enzyme
MELVDILHVAIRTNDLEATNRFYTEVLGMTHAKRPPFSFPGSWLQMGNTQVHVMAGDAALDRKDGKFHPGSASFDHLALGARGFDEYKAKFEALGLPWGENDIPEAGLWQLFVRDPSGILVELNFTVANEPEGSKGVENGFAGDMIDF